MKTSLLQFLVLVFVFAASAQAQVQVPQFNPAERIAVGAKAGNRWQVGAYEVWVLQGDCVIQQGDGHARCREAVLWIDRPEAAGQPTKVIAYLEGDVEVVTDRRPGAPRLNDTTWFGRLFTHSDVAVQSAVTAGKPDTLPAVYWRGIERRGPDSNVQQTQFAAPTEPAAPVATAAPTPEAPNFNIPVAPAGIRRIRAFPRSNVPVQFRMWGPADLGGEQWMAVIDSGVNVIVDSDVQVRGFGEVGTIDISADRMVIWTSGAQEPDLNGQTSQDLRTPLEFYVEGNIVFRQGQRVIHAERMYYDVTNHVGTILQADMLTPAPEYEGLLRLHADVIQQTSKDRFTAQHGFLTSSRMGSPGYRLESENIYLQDIEEPLLDSATGLPIVDPMTGQPVTRHHRMATAANDFLFIGPVPIFYWPTIATDLDDPTYYIRRARLREDRVYGLQLLTNWDGYQLLGIRNKPEGTDFDISLDVLGKRGFGHGGNFSYNERPNLFNLEGISAGMVDYWGIQDQGLDDLGEYRMAVPPEANYRFRLFGQHRQTLPYDMRLSAEVGWISDRNFLEEYYKSEWDENKDQTTGLELKRIAENRSWSITGDVRINDFFTQSNWLPRGDHYWIGQSVFDVFTWHEHSSAAYAQLRQTNVPENVTPYLGPEGAAGPFNYLPWEVNGGQGDRLASRQELDYPFQLGAVKLVPYVLGEAAHWGQDINGESLTRLFWQGGLRASLPMWSVDPSATNELLNVHGLAHKINFTFEYAFAQANQNLEDLPLYDALDDDSVEAFRRRYLTTTYGIPSMSPMPFPAGTPWIAKCDERLYALRTGLQSWVTSPSTEIADDLETVRLGIDQRWQTKRGPADNRRIIDWMKFDTHVTLFPNANRDNFGETVGLLDYDYNWHVGDRLTFVSGGIFDFFSDGQRILSVGGFLTRPPRGSLYAGFTILDGPIESKVLSMSYTYWMSPKWLSSFGTSIDLGSQGNLGQSFTITRVGESFLISAGFNVDASRDSVGASLSIEPRFLPKSRLGNVAGAQIPPAGAFGLE